MGAEILGIFSLLLVPLAAILIEMAYTDRSRRLGEGFLGLGRGRLARGLLAAIGVMVLYAVAVTIENFFADVSQGTLETGDFWTNVPASSLWFIGAFTFVHSFPQAGRAMSCPTRISGASRTGLHARLSN